MDGGSHSRNTAHTHTHTHTHIRKRERERQRDLKEDYEPQPQPCPRVDLPHSDSMMTTLPPLRRRRRHLRNININENNYENNKKVV